MLRVHLAKLDPCFAADFHYKFSTHPNDADPAKFMLSDCTGFYDFQLSGEYTMDISAQFHNFHPAALKYLPAALLVLCFFSALLTMKVRKVFFKKCCLSCSSCEEKT